MAELTGLALVLLVPDVAAALDHYRDYLWVDDVGTLHQELVSRGADIIHGPTERPWQMREIRVRDLNGYVLGFGEPLA